MTANTTRGPATTPEPYTPPPTPCPAKCDCQLGCIPEPGNCTFMEGCDIDVRTNVIC